MSGKIIPGESGETEEGGMKRKQLIELIGDMAAVVRQSRNDLYDTHKYPCGMVHDNDVEQELDELDALLDRAAKVEPK